MIYAERGDLYYANVHVGAYRRIRLLGVHVGYRVKIYETARTLRKFTFTKAGMERWANSTAVPFNAEFS